DLSVFGRLPQMVTQPREKCVVIEHLFEVRDLPFTIDCITSKPAPELVVDAAARHGAKGVPGDRQRQLGPRATPVAQHRVERHSLWELGRAAETTMLGIV